MYCFSSLKDTLSTTSLISPSFQVDPTFFIRGFSSNEPLILIINVLWGSCNIPHTPLCCLKERAQIFLPPSSSCIYDRGCPSYPPCQYLMKDEACHDYTIMLHVMKWSSFLISEWLDLLVSFRVTILLELYRENWQGGNIDIDLLQSLTFWFQGNFNFA